MQRSLTVVVLSLGLAACSTDPGGGDGGDLRDLSASSAEDLALRDDDLAPPADDLVRGAADLAGLPTATIHFIGRFDFTDPGKPRFAYPGSTITTRFSGTHLEVDLEDGANQNRFDVSLDGAAPTLLVTSSGTTTYTLATGLANGEHDVVLARRTESFVGVTTFAGFVGSPLVATPGPTRLIEIIGDSISCGYGILCNDPNQGFSADTEAETLAYGARTARALGVAHVSVAYSGKGITQNYGGYTDDLMPEVWERTLADDSASVWEFSYTPDVVVLHLGTNDFWNGDPGPTFVPKYEAFLAKVRARYPQAYVLVALSPMLENANRTTCRTYLQQVVSDAADPKVTFVEFAQQLSSDGLGCDYHPNLVTNQKMAVVLEDAIRAATGW